MMKKKSRKNFEDFPFTRMDEWAGVEFESLTHSKFEFEFCVASSWLCIQLGAWSNQPTSWFNNKRQSNHSNSHRIAGSSNSKQEPNPMLLLLLLLD